MSEEMRTVESIKVTVTTKTSDGSVSKLVFPLDPYTFQMNQSRQVEPVYETLRHSNWGKPTGLEVKPPGTRLSLSGYVVKDT